MFIQTTPARGFGGQRKRDFLSSPTPDEEGTDHETAIALPQETQNTFIDTVANALVRNLLGSHHRQHEKDESIAPPTLSGETTFILAENRPDNFYQKNCIPCKTTYKEKHIVHRKLVPYTTQKTSMNI